MPVLKLDDAAARWLALRQDAVTSIHELTSTFKLDEVQAFEQRLFVSLVGGEDVPTMYYQNLYKEVTYHVLKLPPETRIKLVLDFNQNIRSVHDLMCLHISHRAPEKVVLHEKRGREDPREVEFEVLRKKLKELEAKQVSELPMCPKCKTKEYMTQITRQDRSGDESASVYPMCMKCETVLS